MPLCLLKQKQKQKTTTHQQKTQKITVREGEVLIVLIFSLYIWKQRVGRLKICLGKY